MAPEPGEVGRALADARMALDRGDFRKSLQISSRVLGSIEGIDLQDDLRASLAATFAAMAFDAARRMGDFPTALRYAERELAYADASASQYTRARALNNVGLSLLELGQLDRAEAHFIEALDLARSSDAMQAGALEELIAGHLTQLYVMRGEHRTVTATRTTPAFSFFGMNDLRLATESSRFVAAMHAGDAESALALARSAVEEATARGERGYNLGIALSNLGTAYGGVGRREEAIATLTQSVEELSVPGCEEPRSVALMNLGSFVLEHGDHEAAAAHLKAAWDLIRVASPRSPRCLPILRQLGLARLLLRDLRRAHGALSRGFELYDEIRADLATEESSHAGLFAEYRAIAELLLHMAVSEDWPDAALEVMERAKARFWRERLGVPLPPPMPAGTTSVSELRSVAGFNGLAICFFVGPNYTYVVYSHNGNPGAFRLNIADSQMAAHVDAFRADALSSSRLQRWRESSRALGQLLLGNVAIEADAVIRHIYIMPDGPLWLLPFDLLTFSPLSGDAEEPLLAEIAPITLGPSMAVLSHLSKGPETLHSHEWKLALIGHPELSQDATPIDGTGVQIRSIRDMAPSPSQVTVLAEGNAVKAQAMEAMPWATHIHLATHAEQRDDSPRLILTDGVLTVADILGRSMQAELVFLSVCAGAYGSQSTGEGVISLARSFVFAGCRCVVAPSWPVPDAETATFVLDFYRRLFDGKPIAVAVHETRNEMRRRGMSIRTWGAFHALGNAERWVDRTSLDGIRFGDQA